MSVCFFICGLVFLIGGIFHAENVPIGIIILGLSHICDEIKDIKNNQGGAE